MAAVLADLGDLVIVVPREETSGTGHAITLHKPIEAEEVEHPSASAAFVVNGTPADCAKLATKTLFADDPPALCVSGLNRGPNVGVNLFYSGTVGAALEAVINGVPAVAVSKEFGLRRAQSSREKLSFEDAARLAAPILKETLARGLPAWHALNVNVPDRPLAEIRGVKLTRQGVSGFEERYIEEPPDRDSRLRRFRIEGDMRLRETDGLTDAEALAEGYVSVTPISLDLTARGSAAGRVDQSEWDWLSRIDLVPPCRESRIR